MTRNSIRLRPAARRHSFVCLILCCSLGLQLLLPSRRSSAAAADSSRPAPVARKRNAAATNLPDLNELRRRGATTPRPVPPVPPASGACAAGETLCQVVSAGAARPRVRGLGTLAGMAGPSFLAVAAAALNGGQPVIGLSPLDFFLGGGYAVSDAPPFSLPVAAAALLDAPSNLRVTAAADSHIDLAWDQPPGATNYRVEWSASKAMPPQLLGTTASAGTSHGGLSRGHSYLYRVCTADGAGACVSGYSNVAMGTAYSFEDDPIVTFADDPTGATVTKVRALHVTQLREAVNSVRGLVPGLGGGAWTNGTLPPQESLIKADDVRDLRSQLWAALSDLNLSAPTYTDPTIYSAQDTGHAPTTVRRAHVAELRLAATRGQGAGPAFGPGLDFETSKLDPVNRTGDTDAYSRNYNWSLPLVSLPGRAGLDFGLMLSYNSLVWTKNSTGTGSAVTFDADRGSPAPGFRLGFPVVRQKFVNPQLQQAGQPTVYSYMLVTPSGAHVELRQTDQSGVYESADSSYLQLKDYGGTLEMYSADGTRLSFYAVGSEYLCREMRDRNGNYITATYAGGQLDTVTDTLGRKVSFIYEGGRLQKIQQTWKRETENDANPADETHVWATFGFGEPLTLGANTSLFQPGLAVAGTQGGTQVSVLRRVGLADGSYFGFEYNGWGQVWKVTRYAADAVDAQGQPDYSHALSSISLDLPGAGTTPGGAAAVTATPQADCPRFTKERVWVENGVMGQSGEVTTSYSVWAPDMASCEVTLPDGTTKQLSNYYTSADGWKKGLTASEVTKSGGTTVRTAALAWEHDGASNAAYQTNPRITQTTISDPQGNARTSRVTYTAPADFQAGNGYAGSLNLRLPRKVEECGDANCSTVLRTTVTDYSAPNLGEYVSRRILGLARYQYLYEGAEGSSNLRSKVEYLYDQTNDPNDPQNKFLAALPSPAAQHDGLNYGQESDQGGLRWRGNANRVRRYSVDQTTGAVGGYVESSAGYNVTGALAFMKDAAGHKTSFGYVDSFYQNVNRTHTDPALKLKTYAYPTAVTDPDGFKATASYNYDLGVVTEARTPKPNQTADQQGPPRRLNYDAAGRLVRTASDANGAYTRMVYPAEMDVFESYTLIEAGKESRSVQVLDGAGRVRASSRYLPPLSDGGAGTYTGNYSGQLFDYDGMGRLARQSNPAEVTASWAPAGEDAASGWLYTQTTYDWKGRPLKTTNTDLSTVEYDYGGCGCAGGEAVSTRDEVGRRHRVTYDELGRPKKNQVYTQQDKGVAFTISPTETPYSTVTNTYDALDRVREVREREEATGVEQVTTTEYDGHGRLWRRHLPQQDANKFTTYAYNDDDTPNTVTDGRGAVTTYFYENNNRHLVTRITYALGDGLPLTHTYTYDAVGNRTSAFDAPDSGVTYQYDDLSRLTSEARTFGGLTHTKSPYTLVYTYNLAGQLETLKDPFGEKFTYGYDRAGQLTKVTGTAFAGLTKYAEDVQYRAWGGVKAATLAGGGGGQTTTYDARMRPYEYRLGTLLREDFTYYADGKLKQITDRDDGPGPEPPSTRHFMSRSYTYDHLGRVTHAGGLNTSPYQQNYGYDAFGNLIVRSGFYGYDSGASKADTAHYTNGRRDGWGYDQDGRLTYSPPKPEAGGPARWWEYDKAGRPTLVKEAASGGGLNNFSTSYDCDGQTIYEAASGASIQTTSYYMVRSSVLGGQVITRLDSSGGKAITYVPTMGLVEARQGYAGGQEVIGWTYKDPPGVTEKVPGSEPAAYDPLGNYTQHTTLQPPRVQTPSYYGAWSAFTNSYNLPTGCIQDGRPADCNSVVHNLADGLANRQGSQLVGNHRIEFDPMPMGSPYGAGGLVPYYVPGGQRREDGSGDGGTKKGPNEEDVIVTNHSVTPGGFWTLVPFGSVEGGSAPEEVESRYPGETLSECLRNALRPYFPDVNVHGKNYSPVDDAKFKEGISIPYSWGTSGAITLGLFDIFYNGDEVQINGGSADSLLTVVEEIAHAEQFLKMWASMGKTPLLGWPPSYMRAQSKWRQEYVRAAVRAGFSYKNDVEDEAHAKVLHVALGLRSPGTSLQSTLCGFKLY